MHLGGNVTSVDGDISINGIGSSLGSGVSHGVMLRQATIASTGLGSNAAKITIEVVAGEALFTHTAWPSVPVVHAVGFMAGLLVAWVSAPTYSSPATGR